jgi:hypothetical protein
LRRLLFRTLLALWIAALCLIPSVCRAAGPDGPGCYPDGIDAVHPAAAPAERPAGAIGPRRRGVGAIYKAAAKWLRDLVGSLTHRAQKEPDTSFGLEWRPARRADGIVPTFRVDFRKARVQAGLRLRF